MMETRYRPGTGGWPNASPGLPSPGPWHESQKDLANGNPPSFIAESGRSAEFCLAHLRAKHFGKFQGQTSRNSGQRASSRSRTRIYGSGVAHSERYHEADVDLAKSRSFPSAEMPTVASVLLSLKLKGGAPLPLDPENPFGKHQRRDAHAA